MCCSCEITTSLARLCFQILWMQRHLFVQHTKAEMRTLRRAIVCVKAWILSQLWGEVQPPSLWLIHVVVTDVFLRADKETRMSTTFLVEAVMRVLTDVNALRVREESPRALASPVHSNPESSFKFTDSQRLKFNL